VTDPATNGDGADFGMTDLEERLRGPGGAAEADRLIARLAGLRDQVEAELKRGLAPGDYQRAQDLAKSLAAAATIMIGVRRGIQ
jgi:type III secretion system YseE family protein